MPDQFVIGALFGLIVAILSHVARWLTKSGALATFALAVVVFGFGAWMWTVPIVTFFVTSSLLSKVGRTKKLRFREMFEKSGARDWAQVLANGGVAGVLVLLSSFFPLHDFYPLYLAALAAAAADTWGTELGVLSKGSVISIVSLKPVAAGTSGGISIIGTIGGALGAMTVAASGFAWYGEVRMSLVIGAAGIAGSLVDSLLGATLQARFRCPVCGAETERKRHCGKEPELIGGVRWIRNDVVNIACTIVGAVVAWLII